MPRRDLVITPKYSLHAGMVAWLLHRITGILLVIYFVMHMLSGYFTGLADIKNNIIVESVVIVLFSWHALNGLRIIFMEFLKAAERKCFKKGVVIFTVLAVIVAGVGLYYANEVRVKESAEKAQAVEATQTPADSEGKGE